ncbi:uncharacterized protein OCT59_029556 [Rhizophagus irregularis]|uniref:uncharacterized protein n=1 Tax=Rhizophagus irregularis TaxID=588596 RepID=UPI003325959D|nr:hypothetical protein OCT59_029556 [Rhizophagus irregularis]
MNNMNLRQTRADQQEHHDSDFCLRKPKRSRTKNSSSNISRHTRLDDATTSANTGNSNSDSLDAQEYIQEENIISPQLQLNENFYYDNDDGDNDNIDDFSNFGNTEIYNLGDFILYYDTRTRKMCHGQIILILRVDNSQDTCLKIECILEFNSLPSILKSRQRNVASQNGYLWMTDNTIIISLANVKSKVNVWLMDINEPPINYKYSIEEIVYYIDN